MTHTVNFARDLQSSYVKFALATYRSTHHAFDKHTHAQAHTTTNRNRRQTQMFEMFEIEDASLQR